jgi:methionyl aminopeptidase
MMVKTTEQIAKMRRAGRIVAEIHERVAAAVRPGVTTRKLDQISEEIIRARGAVPSFKGYHGFPATICTSPNSVIVHGIPDNRALREGDIVGIDAGAILEGWHADAAITLAVGEVSPDAARLMEVTEESLWEGLRQAEEGNRLSDIGHAIQAVAEDAGFSVVREYVGHGIGTAMHEEPQVPNYGPAGKGPKLKVGMVLAIEPMVNAGGYTTKVLDDGWTVMTRDGSLSAHYEHTVAITDNGPEVLTLPDGESPWAASRGPQGWATRRLAIG